MQLVRWISTGSVLHVELHSVLTLNVVNLIVAGKESHPVFRTPSTGAPVRAAQSRTELHKPEQPSLLQLFQDLSLAGREELFFIQLPDCMPGRGTGQKPRVGPAPESAAKTDKKGEHKKSAHLQANVRQCYQH